VHAGLDEALAADTARAHSDLADNSAYRAQIGDEASDDPFTTAALVVEESFSFHRLTGCSMGDARRHRQLSARR